MKYRHHFHAGNFADFWKHLLWLWVLEYAQQKPTPLDIIDTHSGLGFYYTDELSYEFESGTGCFVQENSFSNSPAQSYWNFLTQSLNNQKIFPGSPFLAASWKRSTDRLWLFEKNSEIFDLLKERIVSKSLTYLQNRDGFSGLKELLHQPLKRMVILIDPAYERPEEYTQISEVLEQIHLLRPQACVVLWYPLGKRAVLMEKIFKKRSLWPQKTLNIQYHKKDLCEQQGLQTAGVLLINPPYLMKNSIENLAPVVLKHMNLITTIN